MSRLSDYQLLDFGNGRRRLSKHLGWLLKDCARLTAGRLRSILLTCHTPGFAPDRLRRMMAEAMGDGPSGRITAAAMTLCDAAGRELPCGAAVRWEAE